jgi:Ser/Thr protein kinase RdoA (MazF antagonist)
MTFAQLPTRAQILRLRTEALVLLEQYPIVVTRVRCINHGFNTTFRIDTADGQKFALRINVNSRRPMPALQAEIAWLEALNQETDLIVPHPIPRQDGGLISSFFSSVLGRNTVAVLFSWLSGKDLGLNATTQQLYATGQALKILHQHSATWKIPKGCKFQNARDVFIDSKVVIFDTPMPAARLEVFKTAYQQVSAVHEALHSRFAAQPLHADLHFWNLKWSRGQLSVFDFDDSATGVPLQDFGISFFYLRRLKDSAILENAMLKGYGQMPNYSQAELEAIIAGRQLLLANDLLINETAKLQAQAYLETSEQRLRVYLESGIFPRAEASG